MRIRKISYVFVLCPALVVGMTSCGKSSGLPGKALTYEEMYEQTKKIAPEYNLRKNLSKSANLTINISKFNIDGKIRISGGEPTNFRFVLPAQDAYKVTLNNETGVEGALEVRERLNADAPTTNAQSVRAQFGGNFIYNCIFNPFFTTYTLSYLHSMISIVDDLNIVSEKFSLDGKTSYASYSIPDLKTFSELADEWELSQGSTLFTVFRGTDGSVSVTFGFDEYGYMKSLNLKANSKDIALIGDYRTREETFRGLANVNFSMKIKQNFYKESDYHTFSANDFASNGILHTREVTPAEYADMGFNTRKLDSRFVQDVLDNYSDVILPGYGADFIIEHKGKTSNSSNMVINIDDVNYPISSFIVEPDDGMRNLIYSWSANGATMIDGETRNGRSVINYPAGNTPSIDAKTYYPITGKYTFVPSVERFDKGTVGAKAALFEEMLKTKTMDGHKRSSVNYSIKPDAYNFVKEHLTFEKDASGLGKTLIMQPREGLSYANQDLSTEINALPYGYMQYSFRLPDGGIDDTSGPYGISYGQNSDFITRTDVAEMVNEDGTVTSHGILDVYNNVDKATGTYTSPIIRPAKGFKINPDVKDFQQAVIKEIMVAGKYAIEAKDLTVKTYKDAKDVVTGFDFTLSKDCIDKSKQLIAEGDDFAAPFKLVDYADVKVKYDPTNSIFIRDIQKDFKTEGAHSYIGFNLVDQNGSSNDARCFNPGNGLEEGLIQTTVKNVTSEKGEATILEFEDFTIRADDGYLINDNLLKGSQYGVDNTKLYYLDSTGKYIFDNNSVPVRNILWEFAKVSSDKKEITFSMKNLSEDKRIPILSQLYSTIVSGSSGVPYTHLELNMDATAITMPDESYKLSLSSSDESFGCMNVVPGEDYTYVQILPSYTSSVNKDLKFVFDF